ncbi:outer membrane beta-barrel protein [Perlabentimonas gracilis]|uniref:outer membrane beta-barrel protein n=1 Tax=Perlabentimonas gracilis TaxID=2715279 RepID=UPI0014079012|nr:outer membrane beta-barrel protein [Perlabentimonas gracilis]NHB69459.1 porin family protein [Perlabentimonas gracilis]
MKRIAIISVLLLMVSAMAIGQNSNMWAGGSLAFSNENNDGTKGSVFTFMPQLGYIVNDNFTVGGAIGFSSVGTKLNNGDKNTDNTLSIVPFARYSVINLEKISIFAQGELPLHFYSGTNYDGSSKNSQNSIGIAVRPGLSYSFNERWGANLLMPSIFSFITHSNNYSSVNFGINNGYTLQGYLLNTSIGFIYKF